MGLDLEQSPYGDKAPFAVDQNGNLAVNRGAANKGALSADPGKEFVAVSRIIVTTATSLTLTKADHGAVVGVSTSNSCTVTLPAASTKGLTYTLSVGVLTGSGGHNFTPQSSDTILFTGKSAGQALTCSAATDVLGDNVTLVADGTTSWYIASKTGTWA